MQLFYAFIQRMKPVLLLCFCLERDLCPRSKQKTEPGETCVDKYIVRILYHWTSSEQLHLCFVQFTHSQMNKNKVNIIEGRYCIYI